MIDLMIEMALCLIGALVLGFIIGWLLSKISAKKRYKKEIKQVEKNLIKSEDAVKKLKEINLTQQEEIDKAKIQNIGFHNNKSLLQKNMELKILSKQNKEEIKGLETVLMKAEEMIVERNRKIIELEKDKIGEPLDKGYEELLITKDQFSHIESQLILYQKEIAKLKEINKKLKDRHI